MRFIVNSGILSNALQIANKAITNSTIAIFSYFKFDIKDGVLTVSSSNMTVFISTKINIEANEDYSICVPNKVLSLLKDLSSQPLTFVFEDSVLNIISGNGKYQFPTENALDFPVFKKIKGKEVVINSADLMEGFYKSLFAVSTQNTGAAMENLFINIEKNAITFTGTNGHILGTFSYQISFEVEETVLLPIKVVSILESLKLSDEIEISIMDNYVEFKINEDTKIQSVVSEEKYPDCKRATPLNNPNILKLNTKNFLDTLKRVSKFGNSASFETCLIIDSKFKIVSEDTDLGQIAEEEIGFDYYGEPIRINFNGNLLLSVISKIFSDDVFLSFSTPNRGCVIKEVNDFSGDENLFIIMPIMDKF